jgi:hypothetical protein
VRLVSTIENIPALGCWDICAQYFADLFGGSVLATHVPVALSLPDNTPLALRVIF